MKLTYLGGADGSLVAVSGTSVAVKIADDSYESACTEILIQNIGADPCWVKTGQANAIATQRSVMIPPQWRELFRKDNGETHLAAVTSAGKTTSLVVTPMPG